ncbi:MAG: glutathione S-transferase family protein [Pseudomonadota bacterium]
MSAAYTLYHASASPFVRSAHVAALELGIDFELKSVTTTPVASDPVLLPANPLGKIPALARPDGPTLFDSRVICRYLDAQAGGRLYPAPGLWEVLTLEALAHGVMEAAVISVYEVRLRPEAEQNAEWLAGQWAKVTRALDVVEAQWMSHLSGPLTMAQIALACGLGYLDLRHPDKDWRPSRPGLAGWYEVFAARPAMIQTEPA